MGNATKYYIPGHKYEPLMYSLGNVYCYLVTPQEIHRVASKLKGVLLRRKLNERRVDVGSMSSGRLPSWLQQFHWRVRGLFNIPPLLPRMKEHFVIKDQYVGPGNTPFRTRSGPREGSSLLFSWGRQPSVD